MTTSGSVLTLNAGSSSVRYAIYTAEDAPHKLLAGKFDRGRPVTEARGVSALVTGPVLASYLNCRFLRLPLTIELIAIALTFATVLVVLTKVTGIETGDAVAFVHGIDFSYLLLHILLPFLVVASALHVNGQHLRAHRRLDTILPPVGVPLATVVTGWLLWLGGQWVGVVRFPTLLPLAAGILFPFVPSPEVAALTMPGSTLIVANDAQLPKRTKRAGIKRARPQSQSVADAPVYAVPRWCVTTCSAIGTTASVMYVSRLQMKG